MQLDLTDEETLALLNLLSETTEYDRFPRVRGILANVDNWTGSSARDR